MSDEEEFDIEATIKDAIGKYIAGFATEFVLVMRGVAEDGDYKEAVIVPEEQALSTTSGLLTYATIQTDMLFREGIKKQREEGGW